MKWSDVYRIEPLDDLETAGGIVGWHVIGKADRKNYAEPGVLPYGYSSYRNAVHRAMSLFDRIVEQTDKIILG